MTTFASLTLLLLHSNIDMNNLLHCEHRNRTCTEELQFRQDRQGKKKDNVVDKTTSSCKKGMLSAL